MHRCASRATLFAVALSVLPAAQISAQEATAPKPAAPLARLELVDGDSIVFLGDSITHQRLYTQYVENFFYTRFPKLRLRIHNAGVGGAQAWDALARFDRDVARYKPKYVTILLGMNDGRYQPFNQEIFDTYTGDMTELLSRIRQIGATPILMTPTMFDARAARARKWNRPGGEFYNSVLAYYGTWLREVAVENGYGFVDMWGRLNNLTLAARKDDPAFTMIKDAVHPGPAGQLVMAYSIIDDMSLRKPLSTIRIVNGRRNQPKANSTGGSLTDLQTTDDGLQFTWQATGLPWVALDDTAPAGKLLRLGHRASREALIVTVLKPGRYELQIDGEPVGTYSSTQLARGIELQDNDKTPQHAQAKTVAELNRDRNAGPVGKLRNEWRRFQQFARVKRSLDDGNGDRDALSKQLARLEQQMEGMDDRIAEFEAAAKAIEDQIFEANQPVARVWTLSRVKKSPGK